MGATFSRIKNWAVEVLTNTDLNAEIDNILNNLGPAGVDDYSVSVAQMQIQTTPGDLGTESQPTSLAGEIERLRYVIKRMIGTNVSYWYQAPDSTIHDLVSALGSGLPTYRIASGRTTGNSSQLCALIPANTTSSLTLTASVTNFSYYIAGTQYTITANQTLTGLSGAPSTNNTCTINETAASGQQWTKFLGQYGTTIEVTAMGTEISNLVGKIAGFKNSTEYFLAYVESTAALTNAWRGCFFDNSGNPIKAAGLTNAAGLTLMRTAWVFANTNSSLAVTYNNPSIAATQPSSPSTGDYWFDLSTTAWKTYNSTTWVASNSTLIGMSLQDTGNCVAARTFDSYKAVSAINTLDMKRLSNTQVQADGIGGQVNVFGTLNSFQVSRPIWDITSALDSGITESANTLYYLYMKESGAPLVSDVAPMNRKDLRGLYHPSETWRCLASVNNNVSTNFETPVRIFRDVANSVQLMGNWLAYNALNSTSATAGVTTGQGIADLFPDTYVQVQNAVTQTWPGNLTYGTIGTMSLTPGLWEIGAFIQYNSTNNTASSLQIGLDASATPGSTIFLLANFSTFTQTASLNVPMFLTDGWLAVQTTSTVYLVGTSIPNLPCNATNLCVTSWYMRARRLETLVGMPK